MTLVVCIQAQDALILAADSRGTIGDPRGLTAINDTQIKLHKLGRCGLAAAGASEMAAVLLDELEKQGVTGFNDIDQAVGTLVPTFSRYFAQWFGSIPISQWPGVLLTLAGYRYAPDRDPEPKMYLLNSQANFAPQLFTGACLSGVPQYAVYLVHRYYDPSISSASAQALAEYLINETASQDPKVGGRIRIAEITPEAYRELSEEEVKSISRSNEQLNRRLRKFFLQKS